MDSAIQIIDENKIFKYAYAPHTLKLTSLSRIDELASYFKKSSSLASSYNPVIAVFGSQSSGKSTLLNYLFDTKFDVMLGNKRAQTTHGIWLAVEPKNHTIILDVEGSDGRERGEDKDFERKAALFSLAIADVLIINVWENSIGLYNAASINLLKTVLDVYFEIYNSLSASKTTILFVVRDFVGVTPAELLEAVIKEELQKIWESIEKPTQLENNLFEDVFKLRFAFLPHKIFKSEEFLIEIDNLREQFLLNRGNRVAIFDETSIKRILLQDFPFYSSSIWDIVNSNKSLDLPTQQELLTQHRCEETITEIFEILKTKFSLIYECIEKDELESSVKKLKLLTEAASAEYFEKLHRYSNQIVQLKSESLKRRFKELIEPLFNLYCTKIENKAIRAFELELNVSRNVGFSNSIILESIQTAILFHRTSMQGFVGLPGNFNFDEKLTQFESELNDISRRISEDYLNKCSRQICKQFKSSTRSLFADCFSNCSESFWDEVENSFMTNIVEALNDFDLKCESFLASEIFLSTKLDLENELVSMYREGLFSESGKSTMNLRFTKVMDKNFRFDAFGRPRYWENLVTIDEAYDNALEKTESFIEIISLYSPSESFLAAFPEFEREILIISNEAKKELKEFVKKESEITFIEAKRSLVSGSTSIPAWCIVLLLILGWNEFVAIISSPIYLCIALTIISVLFLIHHLKLSGPLMTILRTTSALLSTPIGQSLTMEIKAKNE